jgi:hypothetical protein
MRSEEIHDVGSLFMVYESGGLREFVRTLRRVPATRAAEFRPFLQLLLLEPVLAGGPVPADIDPVLSRDTSLYGALHAVIRGEWGRHATIVAGLRREAAAAAPDAPKAKALHGRADVAEGFGLWQRGRPERSVCAAASGASAHGGHGCPRTAARFCKHVQPAFPRPPEC